MTLEDFRGLLRRRIPTPEEFLVFVEVQGWKIKEPEAGRAVLSGVDRTDPLAVALARMLGREPYRTNVLNVLRARREKQAAPPAPVPARRLREWLWDSGHTSTEDESWGWADDYHPAGAWWSRRVGERDWERTPCGEKWGRDAAPPAFAPAG